MLNVGVTKTLKAGTGATLAKPSHLRTEQMQHSSCCNGRNNMEFDFVTRCEEQLKPLGVKVVAELGEDNVYYVTFDGNHSHLSVPRDRWAELFGLSFGQVATRTIMQTQPAMDAAQLSEFVVQFKIGTLFDILSKEHKD